MRNCLFYILIQPTLVFLQCQYIVRPLTAGLFYYRFLSSHCIYCDDLPFILIEHLLPFPIKLPENSKGNKTHNTVDHSMEMDFIFQFYIFAQIILVFLGEHCYIHSAIRICQCYEQDDYLVYLSIWGVLSCRTSYIHPVQQFFHYVNHLFSFFISEKGQFTINYSCVCCDYPFL